MKKPWMPLYIADYMADTGHLSTVQHGAYLLLLMHYWRHGGLPNDDTQLAAIARLPPREWARHRPVIHGLFEADWSHRRVDAELAKSEAISSRRRQAAGTRWGKTVVEFPANNRR